MNKRTEYNASLPGGTGNPVVVPANSSLVPISNGFPVDRDGCHLRVNVLVPAGGSVVGSTITLQERLGLASDGVTELWNSLKTATVAAPLAADTYIILSLIPERTGDQPYLPITNTCRLVATTGAGASLTVDRVYVMS